MDVYFLRHGLAGHYGDPQYKDDSLRPLTDEGREKMRRAGLGMKNLKLTFDVILSSPYLRARQTAEIVAKAYKIKKVHLTDNLLSPASVEKLLREVHSSFPRSQNVLLVGHEPHLTAMVCGLLKSKPLAIDFKKGGLCNLTIHSGTATLNWLLTQTQLGLIAKGK